MQASIDPLQRDKAASRSDRERIADLVAKVADLRSRLEATAVFGIVLYDVGFTAGVASITGRDTVGGAR